MSIPVFRSYIRRKDMDTVLNCLVTDSVGPGEYLDRFQKYARESLGYDFGFALRSPITALETAFDALGLSPGDVVAIPALSPVYYIHAIRSRRLVPFFVDANPDSCGLDLDSLRTTEPKPKALVLFEALGLMPASLEALGELGLPIIEDISQSLGAYSGESRAGSLGQLSLLGLEHGGLVTAGGGALLFAHGRRVGTVLRNVTEAVLPEQRLTDYNAALGLAQFRDLETSIAKRRDLAAIFAQSLARTRHRLLTQAGDGEPGYYAFPVLLDSGMKDVRAYASKKDVETEPAFDSSLVATGLIPDGACPRARSLVMRCLLFPLHQRIGASGAQKISRVLATLP
jgi:perosamine synthetase